MPPKAHRAGATGLTRTHSRSSSGGSKVALNLHFTQKDPAPPKQTEKQKKNGYHQESRSRTTSPYPRVNSSARVASREQLQPPTQRHAYHRQQGGNKAKAGFTIASPSADEEDDWISSESGAATPNSVDSDTGRSRTPVEQRKVVPPAAPPVDESIYRSDTPRALPQSLSRVPTIRPPEAPTKTTAAVSAARASQPAQATATILVDQAEQALQQRLFFTEGEPRVMETRSENTSPVHRNHHPSHKRYSVTRPPSTHSIASRSDAPLRPHPLIRGQSFGQNVPMTPRMVPLAPLTVTSEASPIQMSSSPTHDDGKLSTSPSSIKTTQPSSNRRTSVSSVRSVVTLPNQAQIQPRSLSRAHDRNRTLSSISSTSSSSVQALSSLAQLPTTRPSTPQYTAHFPAAAFTANLEVVHPLLPPPYLGAHMSILLHRSPLKESYDRVVAAREHQERVAREQQQKR